MDLNKSDMLQLLSYLEGELQARDIVVAALNAEKVKQMTLRAKRHRSHPDDPLFALQRDSEIMKDCSFGEAEVKAMYDDQLNKLENLIGVQHAAQKNMREVLGLVEKKYHKMCTRLEMERRSHLRDNDQDQRIVELLSREKERLIEELEKERKRCKTLEAELSSRPQSDASSDQETLIAVQLIKEQTRMMRKMADLKSYVSALTSQLEEEQRKASNLERSISEETEKLMHEEAMQEKRLSEFDFEKQQLLARLSKAEAQQKELLDELSKLQQKEADGANQAEVPRGEQNGVKATNPSGTAAPKFPAAVASNQSQSSIKRPSSAQPISSKLQHPMNLRQQLSQTNQQPQQSGNLSRNLPPSLVPTSSSAAPQQSRIRTFGPNEPTKIGMTQQMVQGPLVKRMLSQGSKAPPPVPPNKPQVPVLPQVQQNPSTRFAKPSNA